MIAGVYKRQHLLYLAQGEEKEKKEMKKEKKEEENKKMKEENGIARVYKL